MVTRAKTPLERRILPFYLANRMSEGATLVTVQAFASRTTTVEATTLAALVTIGDTTIQLNANPRAGGLIIIDPSGSTKDRLKVVSVSGASPPFIATVVPPAWFGHSNGAPVNLEPGMNYRLLVDDTPTPIAPDLTDVWVETQKGADGHSYRISVVGLCDDGQIVEEEVLLLVSDVAPTETEIKQPTETLDIEADLANLLSETHQDGDTFASAIAYASSLATITTNLSTPATAEDGTLSLVSHPGIGALLTLNAAGVAGSSKEKVYVSAVSGTGPYVATIQPTIEFDHGTGESVLVSVGISANFLVSPTSSIEGNAVRNRAKSGADGQTFKMVWLATTSQAEKLQHSGLITITDL